MKNYSATQSVEDVFPDAPQGKWKVENASTEGKRVVQCHTVLLAPNFESAARMGVLLVSDDPLANMHALRKEVGRLSPTPHLQYPEDLRHDLRRTMFDELVVGEPSNILSTTQANVVVVRYEAMSSDIWKRFPAALLNQLDALDYPV